MVMGMVMGADSDPDYVMRYHNYLREEDALEKKRGKRGLGYNQEVRLADLRDRLIPMTRTLMVLPDPDEMFS
ncbi:MAG: hypothetical protein ABIF89_02265 [bacterium]